jgi:hypothetical protein
MELLVAFFVQFVRSLDQRSLWPLQRYIPDYQHGQRAPADMLRDRPTEIGPWKRRGTYYVVLPALVIVFALLALMAAGLLTHGEPVLGGLLGCFALGIVVFAGWLIYASRGGTCILHATGVDFCHRGVTVFCPWDLFCAFGHPIYFERQRHLVVPVAVTAMEAVEMRRSESVVAHGEDVRAGHLQLLPTGEIRLQCIYAVEPLELGEFLLTVGHSLGTPAKPNARSEAADPESSAAAPANGWLRVSLTRLVFPPNCCHCNGPTDGWQNFDHSSFLGDNRLRVLAPVCTACQRSNRRRYWLTYVMALGLTVMGGPIVGFFVGLLLDVLGLTPGPGAMPALLTVAGLLISLGFCWVVAHNVARARSVPIWLSQYQPGDGTVRIRFRNHQYAERFVATLAAGNPIRTG